MITVRYPRGSRLALGAVSRKGREHAQTILGHHRHADAFELPDVGSLLERSHRRTLDGTLGRIQHGAPTAVNLIDGVGSFQRVPGYGGIKVEPGSHVLVLAAAPMSAGWTGGTDLETLKLDFAPCKRYYINARYDTRLSTSWKPFVDYVETIAGCTASAAK